jgi:hypothetical protein
MPEGEGGYAKSGFCICWVHMGQINSGGWFTLPLMEGGGRSIPLTMVKLTDAALIQNWCITVQNDVSWCCCGEFCSVKDLCSKMHFNVELQPRVNIILVNFVANKCTLFILFLYITLQVCRHVSTRVDHHRSISYIEHFQVIVILYI